MPTPAVRVDVRPDSVAVLTVDQSESKVNVLSQELWAGLEEAIDSLSPRADLRGLVVASGKPGVFIAGADLKLLASVQAPNDPTVRAFIEQGLRVLEKLESLPFPTCAAIDGVALGGGLEVALACDYRVAGLGPKVQLGLPEVKLGLIPGWGGTQRLPRVVGLWQAAHLLATGQGLTATDVPYSDLIDRVAQPNDLLDAAVEVVQQLFAPGQRVVKRQPLAESVRGDFIPPGSLSGAAAEAIRVMVEGTALPLADGIKLETDAFMRLAGSPESKRLIAEFFANRKR